MGNPAELIPNITFFVQLGLFFICYTVLHNFVFTPYLHLLEVRRSKTTGLKEKSVHDREKAEKLKADYETMMKTERRKVTAWADDQRKTIADEERAIISEARDRVGNELKKAREELSQEVEKARKELAPLVTDYSSQIASKLIGRKVNVTASAGAGTGTGSGKRLTAETTVVG